MHQTIQYDLVGLLAVFDDLSPLTDEEQCIYWLTYSRADATHVTVNFSAYERQASVIIRANPDHCPASLHLPNCQHVKVLDESRRIVELAFRREGESSGFRCVLSLDGANLMEITELMT